ncbi:putative Abortive infection protein [Candidatus Filomicrobium marinum]|uniref:CAAX prenyl protease 2/Lysostaphin resistance protein A-like domain-containing protein n=2 Tax=Filomicrobium TaxID=119044 RepID=A0A1H0MGW8_9HYPH|nr:MULTISPECIES: CPBP family intramembrane glutamic endopeptidase [Filomicrobium]MCV0369015.1 CPBP family intramembrane metalloprotease [Filomicrobium sp.]CFX64015.1 putative Abortive infection protein [Candidatus Filomicrobium marinum]CPR22574.1 putative Abortive infection protein [Candidatus Filomicrobium marinum]SDO79604.1 hypothetical protein SAMN04488061_1680 [Filomicrobium insigne]
MPLAYLARAFPYTPAYHARTGWGPVLAVLATFVIFIGAAAAGFGILVLANEGQPDSQGRSLWVELLVQLLIIGLTVLAAGFFGGRRADVLALRQPAGGWRDVANGLAFIAGVTLVYTLLTFLIFPDDLVGDLRPLWEIMQSPWGWALALVAVIGAPLSEELLFRGFLQSALAKSRLGFVNAAVITTVAWTGLHAGYSLAGLGEVFLVGLVLSWLLWQTGSLWVPIICHGVYNGVIISYLAAFPVPA